jgi:hypothetical protein
MERRRLAQEHCEAGDHEERDHSATHDERTSVDVIEQDLNNEHQGAHERRDPEERHSTDGVMSRLVLVVYLCRDVVRALSCRECPEYRKNEPACIGP